jgi:exodeoxyribonuclease VII large subunit
MMANTQAGVGNLYERFQQLKAKLEAEGLFAADSKRPLPAFPRRIGIVTSPQAAALRDVLTTLSRRAPHVGAILFPTPVQGEGAAAQIAAAIEAAGASGLCDTLIVCRGGGSIEDMWSFNEEVVARAIRACPIPVVSGVGHETDFTIADFAADQRAPTPTAAAEMAAPEREQLFRMLSTLADSLRRNALQAIEQRAQRVDWLAHRLTHPAERLNRQRETLRHLEQRLAAASERQHGVRATRLATLRQRLTQVRPTTDKAGRRVDLLASRLEHAWQTQTAARIGVVARLSGSLQHLNPQAVLGRGYAVVRDADGQIVRDAAGMEPSAPIRVYLAHGRLDAMEHQLPATALRQGRPGPAHVGRDLRIPLRKHHQAYVTNLNNLIKGTEYETSTSKPSSRRPRPAACTTTPPRSGTTPSSGTA